ncbi:MAG: polymorphic toxin-type HINT domain-containing protein [Planctomycetota bacterium]|nr:polymorphic toxin-type HINT domain-containing protein [Planctomycetota bacterium]
MTRFLFKRRQNADRQSQPWTRRVGLVWLCLWLSVAAGFGHRYLTHDTVGEVQASIEVAGSTAAARQTKPIERIQVGERVAFAINPTERLDTSLGKDVNPATWRKVTLRTENGSHEIVLLRPESWIKQHQADSESTMKLAIPEVGVDGLAEVLSIEPCPPISPGEGRIVISTFTHIAPETICMYLEGLDEPIRCTPNHITWSVEHKDFVEALKLQPGNLVLCDDGVRELVRVEKLAEPIRVYNLEVQGQHVYQVSSLGMLVHNVSPGLGDGASLPSTAADELAKLNKMKQIVHRELQRSDIDDVVRLIREQDMATVNARIGAAAEQMRKIINAPVLPN